MLKQIVHHLSKLITFIVLLQLNLSKPQRQHVLGLVNIQSHCFGFRNAKVQLNIQVPISTTVNIDSKTALHQVTAWLVSEVSNMLIAGVNALGVDLEGGFCPVDQGQNETNIIGG